VDQELEEGLRSVAAPVRDGEGRAIAAVNVSTHAGRRSVADAIDDLLEPLLRTAREIEADLHQSAAPSGARRAP
jgi:IclR family pca regulon transcriptional regulator